MSAQCLLERYVEVEHVSGTVVLLDDLTKHVAVVLRQKNALDDDVVADARAVPDGVRDEAGVVRIRDVVLTQDHSAEMVLPDVRCAWSHVRWSAAARVVLPDAELPRSTIR